MRRRRKASKPGSALRRLALAGRWEEVRALLQARLERDPHDAEARSELSRLQQGLPLRAVESPLVRQRREKQEMQEELAAELAFYRQNPAMIEQWEPELLARRRKRLIHIRRTLGRQLEPEQAAAATAYLAELNCLHSRYRGKRRRVALLLIATPLSLLIAALGAALHHRSEQAEAALRAAFESRNEERIARCLALADSGINRLVNPSLPALMEQVRTWQERTQRELRDYTQLIAGLEAGRGSISTLPLARRAALERWLAQQPPDAPLRARWQQLCQQEADILASQRQEVAGRFCAPLPALPELCGDPAEDDALLQEQQKELRVLLREWQAARELFQLDDALGEPLSARLRELEELRSDVSGLRQRAALLPSARSYTQYRQQLEGFTPRRYAPAMRMQSICEQLPDEERLREQMQDHGRNLPPGMLEAAQAALLQGAPSFPPAFPANARQLQLMEDLFTYRGLQKVLYELSAPTLGAFIVEERPQATEGSVTFTPSPLTPGYTLDVPRRITWHNAQAVYVRRIDATPLVQETGINREVFFRSVNLPTLLDTLLRLERAECPALARAFVFKRLLAVMDAHEWPTMLGLSYAPTLRADARSFAALTRELGLPLDAGCWLQNSPQAARAEEACAQWFRERRHRHYAQEIARNFASLVQVHPRYVGFINPDGKPVLFRELPAGTLLWHISDEGLTTTPLGEEPEAPIAYSPVFVIEKDG